MKTEHSGYLFFIHIEERYIYNKDGVTCGAFIGFKKLIYSTLEYEPYRLYRYDKRISP